MLIVLCKYACVYCCVCTCWWTQMLVTLKKLSAGLRGAISSENFYADLKMVISSNLWPSLHLGITDGYHRTGWVLLQGTSSIPYHLFLVFHKNLSNDVGNNMRNGYLSHYQALQRLHLLVCTHRPYLLDTSPGPGLVPLGLASESNPSLLRMWLWQALSSHSCPVHAWNLYPQSAFFGFVLPFCFGRYMWTIFSALQSASSSVAVSRPSPDSPQWAAERTTLYSGNLLLHCLEVHCNVFQQPPLALFRSALQCVS